mmetsp:Transcript_2603/g.6180  ORF Transcript_2603/g.6180 Transcript_2603/m.6180 type:complete len:204 (-) Transcript_2603:326-937(-)
MGMRIFATLAFILATVVLCFGLVLLNDGMLEMQNEIHEFSKAANDVKPVLRPATATVAALTDVVTTVNGGINIAGDVAGGVTNVLDAINNNQTGDVINQVFQNVSSAIQGGIASFQSIGEGLANDTNATLAEGIQTIGEQVSNFTGGVVDTVKNVVEGAGNVVCSIPLIGGLCGNQTESATPDSSSDGSSTTLFAPPGDSPTP